MSEPTKKIPCEVYSRIVGYYRPTQQWNPGAQQMHHDRRAYQVPAVGEGDGEKATHEQEIVFQDA